MSWPASSGPTSYWRTEPGLLEGVYYRGQAVDHEYFTGVTKIADFGFEIIQPTLGPSHYNREFRDLWGEGVHHMLLDITTDQEEWDSVRAWLESIDVPLAMGADLMKGPRWLHPRSRPHAAHARPYDDQPRFRHRLRGARRQELTLPGSHPRGTRSSVGSHIHRKEAS